MKAQLKKRHLTTPMGKPDGFTYDLYVNGKLRTAAISKELGMKFVKELNTRQRPHRHVRRVRTKHGIKMKVINPHILPRMIPGKLTITPQYHTSQVQDVKIRVPTITDEDEKMVPIFRMAFEMYKNKDNWKLPTQPVEVEREQDANMIAKALIWFTGGAEMERLSNGKIRITSKGYYHYIGA